MDNLIRGRKALAQTLGVSSATVTRLHKEKKIPTFYFGGSLVARRDDVNKLIADLADAAVAKMHYQPAPAPNARGLSRPTDPRPRFLEAS